MMKFHLICCFAHLNYQYFTFVIFRTFLFVLTHPLVGYITDIRLITRLLTSDVMSTMLDNSLARQDKMGIVGAHITFDQRSPIDLFNHTQVGFPDLLLAFFCKNYFIFFENNNTYKVTFTMHCSQL